ncbi:MAG: Transcriptional regulator, XRE family [Candidatus Daviesbacteria bacterium GW2011_GWA2_38_24]|uniref:Transcriptional regulator, XRE family n=1 Tax=Candidatus Daviesbacteria bacterium GW2011_GWA2_38_24 TaxID=1618422 RepID=A0A0G0LZN8_9BACT|nr:MAG: Transcriptional regulator, XRE family [Candidatus Daviesbacteria bacterium GW2011_GWA2_38_24]KKQ80234.1 MAG: Transcriptional regulator, XRE family [Candidatus Daviesbacteria bacterium GW2011_GWA1_38_7]
MLNKSYKFPKELGKKIRRARKAADYSQEKLAEIVRISRTHMGHLEQGRRTPSLELLEKVARALKVGIDELFK